MTREPKVTKTLALRQLADARREAGAAAHAMRIRSGKELLDGFYIERAESAIAHLTDAVETMRALREAQR